MPSPPDPLNTATQALMREFKSRTPIRTGSLIVTIFGDSVAPRGGSVSLGTLIDVLARLDISHRLVRTAVYRLVQDGILINAQLGRRSFYALTENGAQAFSEASSRIYAGQSPAWDGQWHLLLLSQVTPAERTQIKKALKWLGFGSFGSELLAHPHPDVAATLGELNQLEAGQNVVYVQGQLPEGGNTNTLLKLSSEAWQLETLETSYRQFIATFEPIAAAARGAVVAAEEAFYLRTFLVHEYRKILLRDPGLPQELLPAGWQGHAARMLTSALYLDLAESSERFIDAHFANKDGPLPPADAGFAHRFSA